MIVSIIFYLFLHFFEIDSMVLQLKQNVKINWDLISSYNNSTRWIVVYLLHPSVISNLLNCCTSIRFYI